MKPSAAAHYNLATALTMAGSLDEAVGSYEKALELRPDYALAHNNLGAILFQRGQLDAAGVHLREAVRLDPKNADALDNLGRLEQRLGDPRSARQHYEQALVARSDWPLAMVDLAWILAASPEAGATNPKRAADLAQRAVMLTGRRDVVALDALAGALAATGDFDRAIAVVDEALKIAPSGQAADVLRQRQNRYRQHTPPTLPCCATFVLGPSSLEAWGPPSGGPLRSPAKAGRHVRHSSENALRRRTRDVCVQRKGAVCSPAPFPRR